MGGSDWIRAEDKALVRKSAKIDAWMALMLPPLYILLASLLLGLYWSGAMDRCGSASSSLRAEQRALLHVASPLVLGLGRWRALLVDRHSRFTQGQAQKPARDLSRSLSRYE